MNKTLASYRGYLILAAVFLALFGGYWLYSRRAVPAAVEIVTPAPSETPTAAPAPSATATPVWQVYVVGAVPRPGVYALAPDSRVQQAVLAAGGLSAEADAEAINLADRVYDGQRLYVPYQGTPTPPPPTAIVAPAPTAAAASGGGSEAESPAALININTATAQELEALPGIGAVYAGRIVAYREANGPFTDPTQLTEVAGIGPARYAEIAPYITIE
jgi:competence protein ComEA